MSRSLATITCLCMLACAGTFSWGATLTGKIVYQGKPPNLVMLPMSADAYCLSQHKEKVKSQDVIVNQNGTLQYVLIYIKTGLTGTPPTPKGSVELRQEGCIYKPHVQGIQVNQDLVVVNDDATLHNVHTMSKVNPQFNIAQPIKGMKITKKFLKPEIIFVKCEVHRWMGAYIGVFEHPYFAVSGSDGTFTIKDLPAGNYVIEAWQEKLGTQSANVAVAATDTKNVDFTFK
jgi:Carboxypeptidase regulatory-like domain